jgi:hypothetical protein
VTTHDLRWTYISHLIVGRRLDPVCVSKIAGHSTVSVTLNVCADEFNKAVHRDDLRARIEKAGFGALQARALTSCSHEGAERPPLLRHEKNKPLSGAFLHGRYWARTSDPQLVERGLESLRALAQVAWLSQILLV